MENKLLFFSLYGKQIILYFIFYLFPSRIPNDPPYPDHGDVLKGVDVPWAEGGLHLQVLRQAAGVLLDGVILVISFHLKDSIYRSSICQTQLCDIVGFIRIRNENSIIGSSTLLKISHSKHSMPWISMTKKNYSWRKNMNCLNTKNKLLWRIVFSCVNIFIRNMCLAIMAPVRQFILVM